MIKTYYSELPAGSAAVDRLRTFLHSQKIRFSCSGCYCNILFEIEAEPEQVQGINIFIDSLF